MKKDLPVKGTFIKDVRYFLQLSEIPTYLCPIGYVLSTYVLCPIFLDIPTSVDSEYLLTRVLTREYLFFDTF